MSLEELAELLNQRDALLEEKSCLLEALDDVKKRLVETENQINQVRRSLE